MKFTELFHASKPLIGVVHLPALSGHIGHPGMDIVIQKALTDVKTLEAAGFDGILIENDGDNPPYFGPNEQVSNGFAAVMKAVQVNTDLPLGLEILYDMPGTVELAASVSADFVRLDVFVDDVQHSRGPIIKAQGQQLHKLRNKLKTSLLLLTDIQVKHTTMLDPLKTITQSVQQAIEVGSDGLIITGTWTGKEPNLADITEAKLAAQTLPVLIGSGFSAENATKLLPHINGAIVASSLKTGDYIDLAKAEQLVGITRPS